MYDEMYPAHELQQLLAMYPGYEPQNPAAPQAPHDPTRSPAQPPTTAGAATTW